MNEIGSIQLSSGIILQNKYTIEICNDVLKTIKNGLPEEAQIVEVYGFIIESCKDILRSKKITL